MTERKEGAEFQKNEGLNVKSRKTKEVKSNTRQKLEKLMMTAGVIAILVAPGAGAAAKEKLNNWGDLKDKISDLESGEQIQIKMTQEKLDELKPKIKEMGVTIKKKENNVVVIENPSFDDVSGGMEEDAEEKVEEMKQETQESEKIQYVEEFADTTFWTKDLIVDYVKNMVSDLVEISLSEKIDKYSLGIDSENLDSMIDNRIAVYNPVIKQYLEEEYGNTRLGKMLEKNKEMKKEVNNIELYISQLEPEDMSLRI